MYTSEVQLKHQEIPVAINQETGEVRNLIRGKKRNPNVVVFNEHENFIKTFPRAWRLLENMTTPIEYKVAQIMSTRVKMVTNSLAPLNDDLTVRQLAEEFSISRGKVTDVLNKLFRLGVYGKFEYYNKEQEHTKYWVFNPYLAMNGKLMNKGCLDLFHDSYFAPLQ